MAGQGILNADMATISRVVRDAVAWWLGELRDMLPPALLRSFQRRWPLAIWDGERVVPVAGGDRGGRFEVHLPADDALLRRATMPAMSRRDLEAAIVLECDRLMPLPSAQLLLAVANIGDDPAHSGGAHAQDREIAISGIARSSLGVAIKELARTGIIPTALVVEAEGLRFDFLPPARAAGMLPRRPSPALVWWALVAVLLGLNAAMLIWRDIDSVDRLRAMVDARAPIAAAAQKIARRIQIGVLVAHNQEQRRRHQEPLHALAQVTALLPAEAWLQRWKWDGSRLRISGYARGNLDVVKVLRNSGRFADVRNASTEILADIPVGHPFDVIVALGES